MSSRVTLKMYFDKWGEKDLLYELDFGSIERTTNFVNKFDREGLEVKTTWLVDQDNIVPDRYYNAPKLFFVPPFDVNKIEIEREEKAKRFDKNDMPKSFLKTT